MHRQSCGGGLAEHATLPTKLAELFGSVAETLAVHTTSLDPTEENARMERAAYERLIEEHRRAAEVLSAIGQDLASCRDMPAATHDRKTVSSKQALEAFEDVVKREREILALLEKRVEDDQKTLLEMVVESSHA
jgi:hypothetical protein